MEKEKKDRTIEVQYRYSAEPEIWLQNPLVEKFKRDCEEMGILLSKEQLLQFARYTDLLLSWNEVMNLTAITELSEILDKHYLDSLSLVKALDPAWLRSGIRMIDVGTGAGFPGLPIAIAFPEAEVLLMDSLNKRIRFLEEAAKPLSNVQAVHARAEELGRQKAYRGQFDLCCSRAVADLRVLSEYCMPFVKKGGVFLSYKSEKAQEEIPAAAHAIALLGGKLERTETFSLGESAQQRSLLVIRKTKETPNVYPRKAGMPAKEPIS